DGALLLHVSHRQSYQHLEEFSHHVGDLQELGVVSKRNVDEAAHEFAQRIDTECSKNQAQAKLAKVIYYRPSSASSDVDDIAKSDYSFIEQLEGKFPSFRGQHRRRTLLHAVESFANDADGAFDVAMSTVATSPSKLYRFAQILY